MGSEIYRTTTFSSQNMSEIGKNAGNSKLLPKKLDFLSRFMGTKTISPSPTRKQIADSTEKHSKAVVEKNNSYRLRGPKTPEKASSSAASCLLGSEGLKSVRLQI